MYTYKNLGQNGRFGNQLFQIASTIGIARMCGQSYGFPDWSYSKYFINSLPHSTVKAKSLTGYLQDYKWFITCEDVIRDLFKMKFPNIQMSEVFIHFRAYSNEGVTYYHPEQTKEYYENAMKLFEGSSFIVFTDDIAKAKKVLPSSLTFHKGNEMEDFYMMTKCQGGIISNSTFSWWAAWLMNKKTIIPKNWFTSIAPYPSEGLYLPNWVSL